MMTLRSKKELVARRRLNGFVVFKNMSTNKPGIGCSGNYQSFRKFENVSPLWLLKLVAFYSLLISIHRT
jgi:hypothetical protein